MTGILVVVGSDATSGTVLGTAVISDAAGTPQTCVSSVLNNEFKNFFVSGKKN
jgi:hypothetical protein